MIINTNIIFCLVRLSRYITLGWVRNVFMYIRVNIQDLGMAIGLNGRRRLVNIR